jgi:Flp pilus assembly protein TadG
MEPKTASRIRKRLGRRDGAILVLMAFLVTVLLGVAALAVDIGYLYVIRNELQNAADAGALAGAAALYVEDGTAVDPNANQVAFDTATANFSQKEPVEVQWTGGNSGDVERGHWTIATRTFTANASLAATQLWGVSEEELDADLNFINAVRVRVRREEHPATAFFSAIFGYESFSLAAEAVAYIGFSGPLDAADLDQPVAICAYAITNTDGEFQGCNIGRMINSGSDPAANNTAGWTNLYQGDGACSGTNSNELKELVSCTGGVIPSQEIHTEPISTTGGANQVVFDKLRSCWLDYLAQAKVETGQYQPWELMLPVVDCVGRNVGNCPELVGQVKVELLWMTEAGTAMPADAPTEMMGWDWATWQALPYDGTPESGCNDLAVRVGQTIPEGSSWGPGVYVDGMARWDCFARYFKLMNADDSPAPLAKKSMYFRPVCDFTQPSGGTGGDNFGVLAEYPVLVR